jgi:hypothetical protein
MASEHIIHQWRRWQVFGEPADTWHRICPVCNLTGMRLSLLQTTVKMPGKPKTLPNL